MKIVNLSLLIGCLICLFSCAKEEWSPTAQAPNSPTKAAQWRADDCGQKPVRMGPLVGLPRQNPPFTEESLVGELDRLAMCRNNEAPPPCFGDPFGGASELEVHLLHPTEPLALFCSAMADEACLGDMYAPEVNLLTDLISVEQQNEILQAAEDYAMANLPCEVGPNGWIRIEYDFYFAQTECLECGDEFCGDLQLACDPFYNFSINADIRITCCTG